jgi:hypothetical protein
VCEPYVLWLGQTETETRAWSHSAGGSRSSARQAFQHTLTRAVLPLRVGTPFGETQTLRSGVFFTLVRAGALRPKGGKAHRRSEETHCREHELSTQRLSVVGEHVEHVEPLCKKGLER